MNVAYYAFWSIVGMVGLLGVIGSVASLYFAATAPKPKPGNVWRLKHTANPFHRNTHLVRVLEVKDGFVRYRYLHRHMDPRHREGGEDSGSLPWFKARYEFGSHAGEPGFTLNAQQQHQIDTTGHL